VVPSLAMSADPPLGERQPICIEAVAWERYRDPVAPDDPGGPWVRWLVDPASGNRVMQVRSAPDSWAAGHWHLSDTVYIVTKGELIVEGERPYRAGDLRWVRGGFAYGPERSGPEGCEYLFFSLGPYDKIDPDVVAPPLGRWDDPSTWSEGYPQLERHERLREER
jgi:hypothetical protein